MEQESDLGPFLRRQQFETHEERQSCRGYAYSVDLRRSRWLLHSSIGSPLVAILDRSWSKLTAELEQNELRPKASDLDFELFERVELMRHLLGAPRPKIRVVRSDRASNWPGATPLGARPSTARWLLLNPDRLNAFSSDTQNFLIASALGHLHCEHGALFSALYLAQSYPDLGFSTLKKLISPWSSIVSFSADRAGLLGAGRLDLAIEGIRAQINDRKSCGAIWLPEHPDFPERQKSIEEFSGSIPFLRSQSQRRKDDEQENGEFKGIPDDSWTLARCDQRLTRRLGLF